MLVIHIGCGWLVADYCDPSLTFSATINRIMARPWPPIKRNSGSMLLNTFVIEQHTCYTDLTSSPPTMMIPQNSHDLFRSVQTLLPCMPYFAGAVGHPVQEAAVDGAQQFHRPARVLHGCLVRGQALVWPPLDAGAHMCVVQMRTCVCGRSMVTTHSAAFGSLGHL